MLRVILVVVATAILFLPAGSQQEEPSARLDIALSKQNYHVAEPIVVTYRLTNLSDSLVCFFPPAVDCASAWGELAAEATPPKGVPPYKFSGGCAADRLVQDDAGSDIDQHWIKLGPLQSYETTQESRHIGLTASGHWAVEAGYVPMRVETQPLYQAALKERGCKLPPELHSAKVKVSVSNLKPR